MGRCWMICWEKGANPDTFLLGLKESSSSGWIHGPLQGTAGFPGIQKCIIWKPGCSQESLILSPRPGKVVWTRREFLIPGNRVFIRKLCSLFNRCHCIYRFKGRIKPSLPRPPTHRSSIRTASGQDFQAKQSRRIHTRSEPWRHTRPPASQTCLTGRPGPLLTWPPF